MKKIGILLVLLLLTLILIGQSAQLNYNITDSVLDILVNRWAFGDKSTRINNVVKSVDNEEFANWITEFDKKDFKQYQKQKS